MEAWSGRGAREGRRPLLLYLPYPYRREGMVRRLAREVRRPCSLGEVNSIHVGGWAGSVYIISGGIGGEGTA